MSLAARIIGTVIALAGVTSMYVTSMNSVNDTIESGRIVPTAAQLMDNLEGLVGGFIVMFIGFCIIILGRSLCRRPS